MLRYIVGTKGSRDYAVLMSREVEGRTILLALKPMTAVKDDVVIFGARLRAVPEEYSGAMSEAEQKAAHAFAQGAKQIYKAYPLPYNKLSGLRGSVVGAGLFVGALKHTEDERRTVALKFGNDLLQATAEAIGGALPEDVQEVLQWAVDLWMSESEALKQVVFPHKEGTIVNFPTKH